MGGFSKFSFLDRVRIGDVPAAHGRETRLGSSKQNIPSLSSGRTEVSSGASAERQRQLYEGERAGSSTAPSENKFRRHIRIRPRRKGVVVLIDGGVKVTATILDISQSGVALEGTVPGVWVGCMVTVGSRRAKAVRMLPDGMALEFSVPIASDEFDADVVL